MKHSTQTMLTTALFALAMFAFASNGRAQTEAAAKLKPIADTYA